MHVSSLLFAYASFALAFVIGVTYMLLFKEIKTKHLGVFFTRLPSLQTLDLMNQRAIVVGWIFLTIGLVAGVVFAEQARTAPAAVAHNRAVLRRHLPDERRTAREAARPRGRPDRGTHRS